MPDRATSPINFKKQALEERAHRLGHALGEQPTERTSLLSKIGHSLGHSLQRKASTTQHHKWGDQHCLISCKCPCHDQEDAVEHIEHGWIWKKTHTETWHCGLPIRVAVLSYSCILLLALAGRIYALVSDQSVIPWFTIPLIAIVILCCWVGLWLRSPNLMLIAAILSGVVVTDTIVTFFLKFPYHNDDGNNHTTFIIINAVGLMWQLFFSVMNIFACIAYRNHLISLQEYTDYHATHCSATGLDGGLPTSPTSTQHRHEFEEQHIFEHYDEDGHAVV